MTDPCDTLELAPDNSAVARAVQWLEELGERDGWPARVQFALTLSADEAITNIVSYAFADTRPISGTPYIRVMHRSDAQSIHIDIRDNGIAFDPTGLPPPVNAESVDAATIGGHGVQLMHHFLQALSYTRENGENRLALTASLSGTATSG